MIIAADATYSLRVSHPNTDMTCVFIASLAWKSKFLSAHSALSARGSWFECVNSHINSIPPP
jgi:hypothetical protein